MALEIDTSTSATDLQNFYDLLWASSRVSRGKSNRQNYWVCFIIYTQFTNASAGRITQPDGPPMLQGLFMRAAFSAHPVFLKTHITMNVLAFNLPRMFVFTCPFSTHKLQVNNQHVLYFAIQIKGKEKFMCVRWQEDVQTRMWGVLHRGRRSVLSGLFLLPCVTWHLVSTNRVVFSNRRLKSVPYRKIWHCGFARLQVRMRTRTNFRDFP